MVRAELFAGATSTAACTVRNQALPSAAIAVAVLAIRLFTVVNLFSSGVKCRGELIVKVDATSCAEMRKALSSQ